MTAPRPTSSDAQRRRRAHKKSRRGCSSCKLRRVKCDEGRPCCRKCKDFGVACAYDGKAEGLRFEGEGSFDLNETQHVKIDRPTVPKTAATHDTSLCNDGDALDSLSRPGSGALSQSSAIVGHVNGLVSPPDSDAEDRSHSFDLSKLEVFKRFNERTVLSVGMKQSARIYQQEVFRLACRVSTNSILDGMHLTNGTVPFPGRYRHHADSLARPTPCWDVFHEPQDSIALVLRHCQVQRNPHAATEKRESGRTVGKCRFTRSDPVRSFRSSNA